MDIKKEVNPDLYDRNYYLTDDEGYKEYGKGLENHFHPKFVRALRIAHPTIRDNVLDFGCGRGELIYYCAKKGAKVLGIDYSKTAIEIAQETIKKLPKDFQHLARAEVGDVVKYNFQEKYDIIFMIDVVEHMYDWQLIETFKKIKEILSDNGRLIITTPNYYYEKYLSPIKRIIDIPSNLLRWFLRILRGKYKPNSFIESLRKIFRVKIDRGLIRMVHVNVLTPAKLKRLLSEFDMDIRCEDHSKNPISLITQKWWGREIIVIAKKTDNKYIGA